MRRAMDSKFVFDGDVLIGINLGADFTSEHEWGIKGIKQSFGIPSGKNDFGVKRRKVTCVPNTITFGWTTGYEGKGEGIYLMNAWDKSKPDFSQYSELRAWKDSLSCAWDEKSFGVFSTSDVEIGYLHTIYDAFLDLDGVIFLGGGGVFQNSGLVLAIASRVPKDLLDGWYAADKNRYEMEQEVEATGIRDLLQKRGKKYFALSRPHHRESDGKLVLWLNPMEQRENNSGYFTIQDLKEWADGKGPIPKEVKSNG